MEPIPIVVIVVRCCVAFHSASHFCKTSAFSQNKRVKRRAFYDNKHLPIMASPLVQCHCRSRGCDGEWISERSFRRHAQEDDDDEEDSQPQTCQTSSSASPTTSVEVRFS